MLSLIGVKYKQKESTRSHGFVKKKKIVQLTEHRSHQKRWLVNAEVMIQQILYSTGGNSISVSTR